MKQRLVKLIRRQLKNLLFPVPAHLANNQRAIDSQGLGQIEASIKAHYHTGWRSASNYSKEVYEADLKAHLSERLQEDRRIVIPWLDNAIGLSGKRILEIGCGTGSSTVALAEQGATVTGIDIDAGALQVAQDRLKAYGLKADCRALNADEMVQTFGQDAFDAVVFFACLEHMTIKERINSLRNAWAMLPVGGHLAIVETPNRLWFDDDHTSSLPFFHWLPDELAVQYTRFSPREDLAEFHDQPFEEARESFLRRGRGFSFHEVDVALGPVGNLHVVSSLSAFQGIRYKLKKSSMERGFKRLLRRIYPGIHPGFFDNPLFVVIQKTQTGPSV